MERTGCSVMDVHDTNDVSRMLRPGDMVATKQQTAAAEAGQVALVDIQDVADRFKAWRCQDRLSYIQQLQARAPHSKLALPGNQLPPNVQPSQLQLKLCAGSNRLSSTLLPTCCPDGMGFQDVSTEPQGSASTSSSPNSIHWQFALSLLNATHVGPTGFGSAVQPVRHVARCCIFDRQSNRFLGNVHTVPASDANPHKGLGSVGTRWTWDAAGPQQSAEPAADGTLHDVYSQRPPRLNPIAPGQLAGSSSGDYAGGVGSAVAAAGEALVAAVGTAFSDDDIGGLGGANACIVRCAELATDPVSGLRKLDGERLSLYVELNVVFKLVAEDADAVPQDEAKGAGLVDELTTCWAMISLKRCAELVREMTISVPLYMGSIYEPVLLSTLWAEHRKHHPVRSIFSHMPCPQLTFRAGPLPTRPPPLLPYRLMPPMVVARRDVTYLLAAAKLALVQQLAAVGDTHGDSTSSQVSMQPAVAVGGFGDPTLAALPRLLDDPVLLRELLAKWDARVRGLQEAVESEAQALDGGCLPSSGCAGATGCSGAAAGTCHPAQHQLLTALRASVLELAPLLHCSSLPPAHISTFVEHQMHRAAVAARFSRGGCGPDGAAVAMDGCSSAGLKLRGVSTARHPVDVLSRAAGEFVHQPFDVSETRVCMAEQLAANRWSRC